MFATATSHLSRRQCCARLITMLGRFVATGGCAVMSPQEERQIGGRRPGGGADRGPREGAATHRVHRGDRHPSGPGDGTSGHSVAMERGGRRGSERLRPARRLGLCHTWLARTGKPRGRACRMGRERPGGFPGRPRACRRSGRKRVEAIQLLHHPSIDSRPCGKHQGPGTLPVPGVREADHLQPFGIPRPDRGPRDRQQRRQWGVRRPALPSPRLRSGAPDSDELEDGEHPRSGGAVAPGEAAVILLQLVGSGDDPVSGARADGLTDAQIQRVQRLQISQLPAAARSPRARATART